MSVILSCASGSFSGGRRTIRSVFFRTPRTADILSQVGLFIAINIRSVLRAKANVDLFDINIELYLVFSEKKVVNLSELIIIS